jgi:hypothetical protein
VNPVIGWALAVVAVAVGYAGYGWRGVVLAITVVAFWLLLQFSRALRAMRQASGRPVGTIGSAVMLNSRLRKGMRLIEILPITGSLGAKLKDEPETFGWHDGGGDRVEIELVGGRLSTWRLVRAGSGEGAAA